MTTAAETDGLQPSREVLRYLREHPLTAAAAERMKRPDLQGCVPEVVSRPDDDDQDAHDRGKLAPNKIRFYSVLEWHDPAAEPVDRWVDAGNVRDVCAAFEAMIEDDPAEQSRLADRSHAQFGAEYAARPWRFIDAPDDGKADEYWPCVIYATEGWPEDVREHAAAAAFARRRGRFTDMVSSLYALAACDGWGEMRTGDRCTVRTLLVDGAEVWPGVAQGTIGQLRAGAWQAPTDAPVDADDAGAVLLWDVAPVARPAAVLPGLAWRGCTSLLECFAKWGKTTATLDAAASVAAGRPFLGETGQLDGPILILGEMHTGMVRSWIERRCGSARPEFYVDRSVSLQALEANAKRYQPALVVVDPFVSMVAAVTGRADEWKASHVRRVYDGIRAAVGPDAAVLVLHHTRKSDGGSRDSGDVVAGVDMIITMTDADGRRPTDKPGPNEPPERGLSYAGRWVEDERRLTFTAGGYELAGLGGGDGGAGGGDPFQVTPAPDPDAGLREWTQTYLMSCPNARANE